jgi:hypothetical protein
MRAACAIVVLAAGVAAAQSFIRTPVPNKDPPLCVTWNKRQLTYVVDSAGYSRDPGSGPSNAIDAAFGTWQAVSNSCSDFQFIRGQSQANLPIGRGSESTNVVVFRETSCGSAVPAGDPCRADGACANRYHCWDHSDFTIGLTTTTYSTRTGSIYDADIELNAAPHLDGVAFLFTSVSSPPCEVGRESLNCVATDIQNTVTHEIGHAVGFDHVEEAGSTMEPTAPIGETQKRILDLGTARGFCSTYPNGLPPVPCDELAQARRTIDARQVGTPGFGCGEVPSDLGLVAVGVLLLARRLSRR